MRAMLLGLALGCMVVGGAVVLLAGDSAAAFYTGCAVLAAVPWLLGFELRRSRRRGPDGPPPGA
ncbi:MAG: hypothetical protein ACYTGX_07520 [Planctomycetota bacterium]|jgi:hypothetical protein